MNTTIPIAIVINNEYSMQASVLISSIIQNKKAETKYHIHIVTDNINKENHQKLSAMAMNNVKIEILVLGNKYNELVNNTRWPNIIFYKFDVPFALKDYEKIILLDADTIVLKDLTPLYNTNLENAYAGVVPDITQILKDDEFSKQINHYFNAGVILFNAKEIRKDYILEDFINCYKKNLDIFPSPEQDTLNYLFGDNILHLPPKFHYITLYENYFKFNYNKFYKSKRENFVILHFAQMCPWLYWNIPYGKYWNKYYKTSPYYAKTKKKFYNIFFNFYRKIRYNYRFLINKKSFKFNYIDESQLR